MFRRTLVTGAAGFVGANLVRALLQRGAEVHGLVQEQTDCWRLAEIESRVQLHRGDLLNKESLSRALAEARPTAVFHLGIYGAYPARQMGPEKILSTAVIGTLNLLAAAKEAGAEVVVNAGSSSEYGRKDHPMREDETVEPNTYYGVGKAAQTMLGQYFSAAEGLPVITLRLFSVYGPFENPGRLLPTLIARALLSQHIELAAPSIARDFVYVADVVEAFLAAAEKPELSREIINVGSGTQYTLKDAFDAVIAATKSSSKAKSNTYPARPFDTTTWVADTTKLKTLLGLSPRYSLKQGVADMVKWFPPYAKHYA
jgi:nucleoside-diphosphate-sugar epimerase